jgi:hypothetical protein
MAAEREREMEQRDSETKPKRPKRDLRTLASF